ncbi:MAG: 5-deoxy-glucuronate isomerase [Roseiflexaceae bacterium]|nr:5-deoxy-glucuronate isomerase [Roseiflexaceae bacterium]
MNTNPCDLLDFTRLVLSDGVAFDGATGGRELLLVILGGRCTVQAAGKTFAKIGKRANPFGGKAYAVYLPANTSYVITAHGNLDAGMCSAPSELQTEPYLIEPSQVVEVSAGAANFSRTLNNILTSASQPDLPAARLLVGETYVPSGNWSTYPPHKHELDDLPREARHEEMYYFRVNAPEGFGICRHYSAERGYEHNYTIKDSTIFMAPHGYHTTCSAPGYSNYFLWMLAGTQRTQAVALDPDVAWVQKTVPMFGR